MTTTAFDPTRIGPAALTLEQARTYDLKGRIVRCKPGQRVGVMLRGQNDITVTDFAVQGCDVGIVIAGASTRIERANVRGASVCLLDTGTGSTATDNIVEGCKYGIVIMGDDNSYANNQVTDNTEDGILVTGDRNVLDGNEVLRNGGVGIHVARVVPMVAKNRFLSFVQDFAASNVIRNNTALDNGVDLKEFAMCQTPPDPPLLNEWTNNTFQTSQPECIH